jgi:hypothetical protein
VRSNASWRGSSPKGGPYSICSVKGPAGLEELVNRGSGGHRWAGKGPLEGRSPGVRVLRRRTSVSPSCPPSSLSQMPSTLSHGDANYTYRRRWGTTRRWPMSARSWATGRGSDRSQAIFWRWYSPPVFRAARSSSSTSEQARVATAPATTSGASTPNQEQLVSLGILVRRRAARRIDCTGRLADHAFPTTRVGHCP